MNKFIKISKALADENRFKILQSIAQNKEICCMEILKQSHLSQPAVSHHLRVLSESELVEVRREGRYGYFSFHKEIFEEYLKHLSETVSEFSKEMKL